MRIFHIATVREWSSARETGSYTTSTLGRSLAEEGFLHAARREQVAAVFSAFYAEVREPLVLLTIDTERLEVPWREDPVGEDTFPHVYGPLSPTAVVRAQRLNGRGGTRAFTTLFFEEMLVRVALGILAMLLAFGGSAVGGRLAPEWGSFAGAVAGLAVGIGVLVVVLRRRG